MDPLIGISGAEGTDFFLPKNNLRVFHRRDPVFVSVITGGRNSEVI
jgi:hypothetical protein